MLEPVAYGASPSPFNTGKQFAWDSTSLGWFKTCPRLYYYNMVRGLRSKGTSVHLAFGIWYHKGLENYDLYISQGMSHEEALRAMVAYAMEATWFRPEDTEHKEFQPSPTGADELGQPTYTSGPWEPDHNLKTRYNLVRSLVWYVEHFRDDNAKTVILSTGKPAVELSFKLPVDDDLILCGHLDRVVDFGGDMYVMDRKTASSTIGSYYFDGYSPDNQMSLYTFASRIILQSPVRGVIIDAAQIAVGFTRFERGFSFRTEAQSEEWLDQTRAWVASAHFAAESNLYPMNDKACHQYGGCAFRKVCSASPQIRESLIKSDFIVKPWNPLQNR